MCLNLEAMPFLLRQILGLATWAPSWSLLGNTRFPGSIHGLWNQSLHLSKVTSDSCVPVYLTIPLLDNPFPRILQNDSASRVLSPDVVFCWWNLGRDSLLFLAEIHPKGRNMSGGEAVTSSSIFANEHVYSVATCGFSHDSHTAKTRLVLR